MKNREFDSRVSRVYIDICDVMGCQTRQRQSISPRTAKYFLRLANYRRAPKLPGALLLRHGAASRGRYRHVRM